MPSGVIRCRWMPFTQVAGVQGCRHVSALPAPFGDVPATVDPYRVKVVPPLRSPGRFGVSPGQQALFRLAAPETTRNAALRSPDFLHLIMHIGPSLASEPSWRRAD